MDAWIASFFSMLLFCITARCFVRALARPRFEFRTSDYSLRALRLQRAYEIFAWGVLTVFLLSSFLASFLESFELTMH